MKTEHGTIPVPAPAVVNLLATTPVPIISSPIDYECLTPTAAAILTTVVENWGTAPALDKIIGIGYGAGTRESSEWPNVVRVMLGEKASTPSRFVSEQISIIEANLDDFSPQALAYTSEKLFAAGALDVAVIPAVMKKGRSGHFLSVICQPERQLPLQELILTETSTLGVRAYPAERLIAQRVWHPVAMAQGGTVRIKVALDTQHRTVNLQPEYEDCASYATAHNIPLKEVIAEALAKYSSTNKSNG